MINFVVALQAEANPIIDHYRLKQERNSRFPVYSTVQASSEQTVLIISGMGRNMASAATAYLAATRSVDVLINVGIAGHRTRALGTLMTASKITESATGKQWFPVHIKSPLETENVTTFDQLQTSYKADRLHEMEASGFYETALRFTIAELAHSIKIVSDNEDHPVETFDRSQVESLVANKLDKISIFAQHLCQLAAVIQPADADQLIESYLQQWKFTVTQKHQLQRLLQRRSALGIKSPAATEADSILRQTGKISHIKAALSSSKEILRWLQSDTDARAEFY